MANVSNRKKTGSDSNSNRLDRKKPNSNRRLENGLETDPIFSGPKPKKTETDLAFRFFYLL